MWFAGRIRREQTLGLFLNRHHLPILLASRYITSLRSRFQIKEISQFLLSVVLHIKGLLLQPLRQLYLRDRVGNALQDCRNTDHLLNLRGQPLKVIIPIEDLPNIHIATQQGVISRPFEQEFTLDLHIRIEDLSRDGTLGNGTILRIPRDHEVAAESSLALYYLRAQKLGQPAG
jgi:hypothetical protein